VRNRPNTTWWDIAEELDLFICDNGPSGCTAGLSQNLHKKGRVKDGIVHWNGYNRSTSISGLHSFMVMAAYAKNPQFLEQPGWLGLYNAALWARRTSTSVLHVRIPWEDTVSTRKEVKRRARKAKVSLRYDHVRIFWWANWKPVRAKMNAPVKR